MTGRGAGLTGGQVGLTAAAREVVFHGWTMCTGPAVAHPQVTLVLTSGLPTAQVVQLS